MNFIRSFSFVVFLFTNLCVFNAELNATSTQVLSFSQNSLPILKVAKKPTIKEDVSDEVDNDYSDETSENAESARMSRNKNVTNVQRIGITYTWGKWEKWSKCTNSCVQLKRRPCIQRVQNDTTSAPITLTFFPEPVLDHMGCQGTIKKYRLCKDEKCKFPKHLRDEQCANFNRIPYKEKFYNWRGYEKEHNECELFCKPSDSDIFVSMNQSVTDGVPCEKPAVYYTYAYRRKAVCVEGICKAVHTSGAIRPATTNDSRLKCGSVLCQIVSELYSKSKLSYGYNYVAAIPAGAMNLTIKQMAKSDNLLALKSTDDIFIINGNNRASESGIFEYNDDTYDYNREVSTITSKGPLSKAVILLLFVRGLNSGIKYDYTIPVPSASVSEDEELQTQWNELGQPLDEIDDNNIDIQTQVARAKDRKRRKFSWKLLGFGQCNRSCGPGVQPPIFRCIRDSPTRYYTPKRCAFAEKPVFSEDIYHCNRGLCPAYWRAADYSECKCADGETTGARTRIIQCVQEQITGKIDEVAEAMCAKEKLPELTESCNCPRQIRRKIYARGPDKNAKVYSRLIGTPASVRNIHNNTAVLRRQFRDERSDKSGVWLMSEWNQECSAECGTGFEHRSIYCDRTAPYTDLCDLRYTPEQKRSCSGKELECRHGVWFASEWSNCSGGCFNLQRRRTVLCLLDGVVVEDRECGSVDRPKEVANCTHKDVNFCRPKWHYSEWSECSRTCGDGIQRRYAKCLEFDWKLNAMAESNNCKYLDREPVYGTCNVQKCEELDATLNVVQNDPATPPDDCSDEFSNCKRINRQRLCKLQYYKTYCCLTCNGYY